MTLRDETTVGLVTRQAKKWLLSAERLARWRLRPDEYAPPRHAAEPLPHPWWATRLRLDGAPSASTHPLFESGKRHNVALAAGAFDGLVVSAAQPFSFWRSLGRVTAARGYRLGMELAGGCIVPSVGGGLCLLARVLFQAAVYSGFDILERHGHSLQVVTPPAGVPWGFDATVLWPYVDLRFAPPEGAGSVHFAVRVREGALLVTVTGSRPPLATRVEVREGDAREVKGPDGVIRFNRLLRQRFAADGALLGTDVVAVNRTKWLNDVERHRSCLTCNETECRARVVPA